MKRNRYEVFVDGHNQEVEAYAVDIPEYGTFIVHRMPGNDSFWKMSEPHTGTGVGTLQKTKKEAIASGTQVLEQFGIDAINAARVRQLEINSTRYHDENKT